MDERSPLRVVRARTLAILATGLTTLLLLSVLWSGAVVILFDWGGLGCIDGDEAACAAPSGAPGLGAVRWTSWLAAAIALASVSYALVRALRMRRAGELAQVLLGCAVTAALALTLGARL